MIDSTAMANRLGVAKYTVEDWAKKSRIPAFKIGRRWMFDESDVIKAFKLSGNDLSRAIGRVSK
jgi:excisionase family DNA binding protein